MARVEGCCSWGKEVALRTAGDAACALWRAQYYGWGEGSDAIPLLELRASVASCHDMPGWHGGRLCRDTARGQPVGQPPAHGGLAVRAVSPVAPPHETAVFGLAVELPYWSVVHHFLAESRRRPGPTDPATRDPLLGALVVTLRPPRSFL